jgi:hypothetical protein
MFAEEVLALIPYMMVVVKQPPHMANMEKTKELLSWR